MIQSIVRYLVLALIGLFAAWFHFDPHLISDASVSQIVSDVLDIGAALAPIIALVWSWAEKKLKAITLSNGDQAVVVKKATAVGAVSGITPLALFAILGFSFMFAGCASLLTKVETSVQDVISVVKKDVPQGWNVISALWSKFNSAASKAVVVLDSKAWTDLMTAFKVPADVSATWQSALSDASGKITISTELLNFLDAFFPPSTTAAAASS